MRLTAPRRRLSSFFRSAGGSDERDMRLFICCSIGDGFGGDGFGGVDFFFGVDFFLDFFFGVDFFLDFFFGVDFFVLIPGAISIGNPGFNFFVLIPGAISIGNPGFDPIPAPIFLFVLINLPFALGRLSAIFFLILYLYFFLCVFLTFNFFFLSFIASFCAFVNSGLGKNL
jgi:hypothetical protein